MIRRSYLITFLLILSTYLCADEPFHRESGIRIVKMEFANEFWQVSCQAAKGWRLVKDQSCTGCDIKMTSKDESSSGWVFLSQDVSNKRENEDVFFQSYCNQLANCVYPGQRINVTNWTFNSGALNAMQTITIIDTQGVYHFAQVYALSVLDFLIGIVMESNDPSTLTADINWIIGGFTFARLPPTST